MIRPKTQPATTKTTIKTRFLADFHNSLLMNNPSIKDEVMEYPQMGFSRAKHLKQILCKSEFVDRKQTTKFFDKTMWILHMPQLWNLQMWI